MYWTIFEKVQKEKIVGTTEARTVVHALYQFTAVYGWIELDWIGFSRPLDWT